MFSESIQKDEWHETLRKNWTFPLRISKENVTKSAWKCGFGHIFGEIVNGKVHFLCSEMG